MDLPTFDGKQFTWQGMLGISEASTLGLPVGTPPPMALRVRSHRTGRALPFIWVANKNRGDDGVAHVYMAQSGVTLHVYND